MVIAADVPFQTEPKLILKTSRKLNLNHEKDVVHVTLQHELVNIADQVIKLLEEHFWWEEEDDVSLLPLLLLSFL